MEKTAKKFGHSLDQDDFETCKSLLHLGCTYIIGEEKLTGPKDIAGSYEKNMIEGRNKLDELEWGKSRVEKINHHSYFIHFTDHLTHKGIFHIHRCKQKIRFGNEGKIILIEHIHNQKEQNKLNEFYKKVGLL